MAKNQRHTIRMSKKGLTLIETLVVVTIVVILVSLLLVSFFSLRYRTDLDRTAQDILNTLQLARSKTLASEGPSNFGVHFETDKYVLFKGLTYNPAAADNEVHDISSGLEIYNISLGGWPDVVFNRITGTVDSSKAGKIGIRIVGDAASARIIKIEPSGQTFIESPALTQTGARVYDSRHVHFNLGWGIQDATTLKFNFVNIPQQETVSMTNYFNPGRTIFDWEGSFTIAGAEQQFRVHTHLLDASNTSLCIHRDRNQGKNTQEVAVSIIDGGIEKYIAQYDDDQYATVSKGVNVLGEMQIQ